jgi:hypothetical protein
MPPFFYYRKTDDKTLRGEPYPPPAIITGFIAVANTQSAQDEMHEFKATTRGKGKGT